MLRAILFDFDGVIIDSEKVHYRAFRQVLLEEGIDLPEDIYYAKYLAMDDKNCFRAVLEADGRPVDRQMILTLVERKSRYYDRAIKDGLIILPGVPEFIRAAAGRYRLAIGSGALRREIEYALDRAGLRSAFDVIVSSEDIEHSKPAPDCYLTVLARLNSTPPVPVPPLSASECVVIEDAFHGITAAKAAGMRCVGITTSYPAERLNGADLVVSGLDRLAIEQVERLCEERSS